MMIVVTSETIAGKRVVKTLGLVRGNTVRARHIGKDIMAGLRNVVGGEVHEYAKLMAESREQTLDRMVAEAEALGANAVIATRFTTSVMAAGGNRGGGGRRLKGVTRRAARRALAPGRLFSLSVTSPVSGSGDAPCRRPGPPTTPGSRGVPRRRWASA